MRVELVTMALDEPGVLPLDEICRHLSALLSCRTYIGSRMMFELEQCSSTNPNLLQRRS